VDVSQASERASGLAIYMRASLCDAAGWRLTFEDDFGGTTLNASNWVVRNNMTHGQTEKQLYLQDDAYVANGSLVLRTREREAWHEGTRYNFTSGWVESRGLRFQAYGRFEVRARLPSPAVGRVGKWPTAWPAHWLMPEPSTSHPPKVCWPVGGEIDIMEGFTHARFGGPSKADASSVYLSYHWATECGKDLWNATNGKWPPMNDAVTHVDWTQWHTFAVEYSPEHIIWYVDGVARYTRQRGEPPSLFTPRDPMYMILNTALNPWADAALDRGLPSYHYIDRVRWCSQQGVEQIS